MRGRVAAFQEQSWSDHLATLGLATTLTLILVLQGLTEQARTLGEDTVTRSRRRLGADHFTTLFACAMLAFANAQNGDAEQGRDLGEDTRERGRNSLGPDHPITLGRGGDHLTGPAGRHGAGPHPGRGHR